MGVNCVQILPIYSTGRKGIMEAITEIIEGLKNILIDNKWFATKQEVGDFTDKVIECIKECDCPEKRKFSMPLMA